MKKLHVENHLPDGTLERITPHELITAEPNRIAELVGDGYLRVEIDGVVQAKNADEIFLQITMWIALERKHDIYHVLLQYAKMEILSKEQLSMLMILLLKSKWCEATEMFPRLRDKDGILYYTLEEAVDLIEKSGITFYPEKIYDFHRMYTMHSNQAEALPFSVETLRRLVRPWLQHGRGRDKYTSTLVITLYNLGDTDLITAKTIIEYFKSHAELTPWSHGNHRILSLLGFANRERGWDLMMYRKDIAECLFYLFVYEVKNRHYGIVEERHHSTGMFDIMMEILSSFGDQELTNKIIQEFQVMIANWKRNISRSFEFAMLGYQNTLLKQEIP